MRNEVSRNPILIIPNRCVQTDLCKIVLLVTFLEVVDEGLFLCVVELLCVLVHEAKGLLKLKLTERIFEIAIGELK